MGKFYIGKREVKEFNFETIILEDFKNLSYLKPERINRFTKINTNFILQREYGYLSSQNTDIDYLVSRDLGNCILAYFYTDKGDSLLIHCDSNYHFDWNQILKGFVSKDIKFALVGGIKENGNENILSRLIIARIIETLFNVTKTSLWTITLTSESLFCDELNEDDRCDYAASLIFKAFNFLSWFKFGKGLNKFNVDINYLKSETVKNKPIFNEIGIHLEKIFEVLSSPLEFVKNINFINQLIKNEDILTSVMEAMFTKEGYQVVNKYINSLGLTPNYRSLGFNRHTHKLVIVPELFWQLPDEILRNMRLWVDHECGYHKIYENSVYSKPHLSRTVIKNCDNYSVKSSVSPEELLLGFGHKVTKDPLTSTDFTQHFFVNLIIQLHFFRNFRQLFINHSDPEEILNSEFFANHQRALLPDAQAKIIELIESDENIENNTNLSRISRT